MGTYRGQIRSALEAVHVDFPSAFLWFGRRHECSPREFGRTLGEERLATFLLLSLQDHLYRHFYCSGGITSHTVMWDSPSNGPDGEGFIAQLVEANSGGGFWDPDWRVSYPGPKVVGLTKDGLTMYVPPGNCRFDQRGPRTTGTTAAMWHPNGSFNRCPGFYMVYGEEPFGPSMTDRLLRVYWNVASAGAAELVRAVTGRLNHSGMPFLLKLLDDPCRYARCDSAVLYIAKASYPAFAADHLKYIHGRVVGHLARRVPALTKELCPGVSIAENPSRHGSFGFDRCGALAEGVVSASRERGMPLGEQIEHVEDRFRQSNIDPTRPYLNLGSTDDYEVVDVSPAMFIVESAPGRPFPAVNDERCLATAYEIGRLIVRRAIWHEDECNWVGALGPSSETAPASRSGGLGPDLYDGTAGIGLFLGQLFAVTNDRDVRDTALGAIHHALGQCTRGRREDRGLYVGDLGIAVVSARLGILLDRAYLLEAAARLAKTRSRADVGFDLISGTAGRIIGLLALGELLEEEALLEAACGLGERLVATAVRSRSGVSWPAGGSRGRRHLTGLSHGAAGAACSLLDLFDLSGDCRFKRTAEAAFDYERAHFVPRERNWPDFREADPSADDRTVRVSCSNTWCHGAPGIAVSRIRAAEVLPGRGYLEEARVALDTTQDHLQRWLQTGFANYSLCHGVAGNADILLSAIRAPVPVGRGAEAAINLTAELGLEAYSGSPSTWPCGVGGGAASPSLMLGWAGIGHFYLRLARKDIPTPLVPRSLGLRSLAGGDPTERRVAHG